MFNNLSFKKVKILYLIIALFIITTCPIIVKGEENISSVGSVTGITIPRFVTLKARDANVRSGPGPSYPLKLNYKCKGYPLQIISEFENWRKIRDYNSNEGWIHESLLSSATNVIVIKNVIDFDYIAKNETLIFRMPSVKSRPLARIEIGAVVHLQKCIDDWCRIAIGRYRSGWIKRDCLWGVNG